MYPNSEGNVVQLAISKSDWALIRTALDAYSHNSTYQELHSRLDKQLARPSRPAMAGRKG